MSEQEQLDRIEEKLEKVLSYLTMLGVNSNELPEPELNFVRLGQHELMPTEEELRRNAR